MISDFILSLRDRELFFEKLALTADQMQDAVSGSARAVTDAGRKACRWIIRLIKWSLIALGVSLLLAIMLMASLGTGWSPSWLNLILLIFCGVAALAGMVLLAPIVIIMQPAIDAFPSLKQSLRKFPGAIASAAFLILFTLFSYWKLQAVFSPGVAASLLFIMLMIGLGSAVGWVLLPPAKLKTIITSQLVLCFFFVLASAILPKLLPATSRWMRHNESSTAERLDDSISRLVKIDPENPPAMFNADGSSRFAFTRDRDGAFRVFAADVEYDPNTGQKTFPVNTSEKRDEIIAQAKAAREAQLVRERAAAETREAEQRKAAEQAAERDRVAKLVRDAEQRETAAQAAERDRLAKVARLEGYVSDKTLRNNAETRDIAVIACDSSGKPSALVLQAISDALRKKDKMTVSSSLFSESFLTDGYPQKVFSGQGQELAPLGLTRYADVVVFARSECQVSKTGQGDLLSAKVRVSVRVIATADCRVIDSVQLDAAGVGMTAATAEKMAAERIGEEVTKRQADHSW